MTNVATPQNAKTEPSDSAATCDADHWTTADALRGVKAALVGVPPLRQVKILSVILADIASGLIEVTTPVALPAADPGRSSPRSLTPRQRRVFNWVVEYGHANGFPPTVREIGAAFGILSTNGVNDHLSALERKGFISRVGMASRGIRILARPT